MSKQELEKLAQSGRERKAKQKARARAERQWLRKALAPEPDDMRIRECLMARGHFDALGLGLLMGAAGIATCVIVWQRDMASTDAELVAAVLLGIAGALFVALRWLVARGAVQRERRWLSELGFDLDGWFDVMAESDPNNGRLRIELEFAEQAAPAARVQAMMARMQAEPDGDAFKSPFLIAKKTPVSPGQARAFARFQSALAAQVLKPLHAEYKLSRVRILRLEAAQP